MLLSVNNEISNYILGCLTINTNNDYLQPDNTVATSLAYEYNNFTSSSQLF